MAINGLAGRNGAVDGYKAVTPYATLTSNAPSLNTAGTELAGITRQASTWGATAASSATSSPPAFSIGSGQTVAGLQFMSLATGGSFVDGVGVTSQPYSSAGTYTVTTTFTEV